MGGRTGKERSLANFVAFFLAKVADGRRGACVVTLQRESSEERTSIGHGDLPAKSVAGVCQKQDVQKMKYLSQ